MSPVDFVVNFASAEEIDQIYDQCISAARWQIEDPDDLMLIQKYYENGKWSDYVPQPAKQMAYRFLNQYCVDRKLHYMALVAYIREPAYIFKHDAMMMYLSRNQDCGLAYITVDTRPVTIGETGDSLKYALVVESEPK